MGVEQFTYYPWDAEVCDRSGAVVARIEDTPPPSCFWRTHERDWIRLEIGHLFAAAPELLAAAEAILEFADGGAPVHPGAEVVADLRAAVEKAKGALLKR